MASLQKEFKTFYNEEVKYYGNKEIRDKKKMLKDDFKSSFPKEFAEKFGEEFKISDIRFLDQGSYAIGTTINHGKKAFDIDVATIINLDINKYNNPVEIKKIVKESLKNTNRNPIIKEPCITVKYTAKDEEKFHIDFPVYAQHSDKLYLARGYEYSNEDNRLWEVADPEGLNCYFRNDNLQIDGLNLSDEEKEQRNQKRRIIRYMKWWKAEDYANSSNDHEIPPSIALTLLVCRYHEYSVINNEYNDLHSLYNTVRRIKENIFYDEYDSEGNIIKKLWACNLPTTPKSDCFLKLKNTSSHIQKFYNKMDKFTSKLKEAVEEESERRAGEIVVKLMGDKFPLPEEDMVHEEDSFA